MASDTIRVRATADAEGVTTLQLLMSHEMETGRRRGPDGDLIPAHFIQEVTCEHNGQVVATAYFSGGVSRNPYLSLKFTGAKQGDSIRVSWTDNQGYDDSAEATIR
ncbi:thiosulfate oxidation carrier complex protein SoxZ [Thioalkalicoccus limnaeus]|uniref:Thiosulfate oxidation carrier complex protein SoxZ n=1 Tax=Thioalkalicoccus limnaeus TaxID=120681 RepID=A0ABV4BEI9_9GAMM